MATLLDLAKDAFQSHNFIVSCEFYERLLKESSRKSIDLYFGYGDSLAKCGRIKEALDIYAHICYQLCEIIPVEKLKTLASSIIEFIVSKRTNLNLSNRLVNSDNDIVDPLCCPICEDVLKYPVTSLCGHTYCRQCCFGRINCTVCGQKFSLQLELESAAASTSSISSISNTSNPSSVSHTTKSSTITSSTALECFVPSLVSKEREASAGCGGFEQDILIRRLVEKWWSPLLKASVMNEETMRHLESDSLELALKCSNESLETGKCF